MNKNILAENMRRFGTKNLVTEQQKVLPYSELTDASNMDTKWKIVSGADGTFLECDRGRVPVENLVIYDPWNSIQNNFKNQDRTVSSTNTLDWILDQQSKGLLTLEVDQNNSRAFGEVQLQLIDPRDRKRYWGSTRIKVKPRNIRT